LLAVAGVAGVYATLETLDIGAPLETTSLAPDGAIAKRKSKLDKWERALKAAAARRPPGLPPIPQYAAVALPAPRSVAVNDTPPASATTVQTTSEAPSAKPKPKPKPPKGGEPPGEVVVYVPSEPIIETRQPVVEVKCSDAETKAIKESVKTQVAPYEAEKAELKKQIDEIEASYKSQEQALRTELDARKAEAEKLEGDAKKQYKAQYVEPLEAQLRQLKAEKDAKLAPLRARSEELKALIEKAWTDAFANPDCGG
jgi:F0F1-type ATP synthase membrane subunit b/b'